MAPKVDDYDTDGMADKPPRGFTIATRVKWDRTGRMQRQELQHTGDEMCGMPYDLEDIELGMRVRGRMFCENVLGLSALGEES